MKYVCFEYLRSSFSVETRQRDVGDGLVGVVTVTCITKAVIAIHKTESISIDDTEGSYEDL